jgi:uncharacterized repeat protein (TIGR02543 family)
MYARWQEQAGQSERRTITFDSQGGSAVAAITENAGTAVPRPVDPTKADSVFQGWYSAATGGTAYAWPHTLNADVTMYARWQAVVRHTITFDSHGGTAVAAITEAAGTAVHKPAVDPTKEGYEFQGWFSAETGGTLYSWPYPLNADVTMHAQWQEDGSPSVKHTITFESHGGTAMTAISAAGLKTVALPAFR